MIAFSAGGVFGTCWVGSNVCHCACCVVVRFVVDAYGVHGPPACIDCVCYRPLRVAVLVVAHAQRNVPRRS